MIIKPIEEPAERAKAMAIADATAKEIARSEEKWEGKGKDRTVSIGLRLNNPLLLKHGRKWKGLNKIPEHREFCSFTDAVWGIRAAMLHLAEEFSAGTLPADLNAEAGKGARALLVAAIRKAQGRDPYTDETIDMGFRMAEAKL